MRSAKFFCLAAVAAMALTGAAHATSVSIYVDAAPNKFGSPDYAGWEATTFDAVADGLFVNMSSAHDPGHVGTTNFSIEDEVVYSFGDLGTRLTWIYYVEGETVASLAGRFEIALTNIWDGTSQDFYLDYYGSTWLEPTTWVDYDADGDGNSDGVIGTAGMAWWGAYNVNTQSALDADIAAWGSVDETWIFTARLDGEECDITLNRSATAPVPEPATLGLLGLGLAGMAARARRKK